MVPTGDTVMTLGTSIATRIYLSDSRFPVKLLGDTIVLKDTSGDIKRYLSGTRVPVGAQKNSVVT